MAFWNKNNEKENKDSNLTDPTATESSSSSPAHKVSSGEPAVMGGVRDAMSSSKPAASSSPQESQSSVSDRFGKVRSALGPGTVIQGKLSFDTPVRIDGKLSGEVFSSDTLIIGEAGTVEAQLEVGSLIVLGSVKGTIVAAKRVELYPGGQIEGDVTSPVFVIQDNATFNGKCSMGGAAKTVTATDSTASEKSVEAESPKKKGSEKSESAQSKSATSTTTGKSTSGKPASGEEARVH